MDDWPCQWPWMTLSSSNVSFEGSLLRHSQYLKSCFFYSAANGNNETLPSEDVDISAERLATCNPSQVVLYSRWIELQICLDPLEKLRPKRVSINADRASFLFPRWTFAGWKQIEQFYGQLPSYYRHRHHQQTSWPPTVRQPTVIGDKNMTSDLRSEWWPSLQSSAVVKWILAGADDASAWRCRERVVAVYRC